MRNYQRFSWKGANFRICSNHLDTVTEEIRRQRALLETYIERHPLFVSSLAPVSLLPGAPLIVCRMTSAAERVGVGPMAAVAGAVAEMAVEAVLAAGDAEAIVENGGDIYMASKREVVVGLYAGEGTLSDNLGVLIEPEKMPIGICSSSSRMGHSLSLGRCDLACVVSKDNALADAAATYACNLVKAKEDVNSALERTMEIQGILGILIVKEDRVGIAGDFPKLRRVKDRHLLEKITLGLK